MSQKVQDSRPRGATETDSNDCHPSAEAVCGSYKYEFSLPGPNGPSSARLCFGWTRRTSDYGQRGIKAMFGQHGYLIRVLTKLSTEETCHCLRNALRHEGLELAGEVDLSRKIKSYTGLDFPTYTILNVWCPFATFHALLAIPEAGLFVPFHLVVASDNGQTSVSVVNPDWLATIVDRIGFRLLAKDVGAKLRRALSALETTEESCRELKQGVA
jgi:uncharacterized protein (DUF302 family)